MLTTGRHYPEIIEKNLDNVKSKMIPIARKFYSLFRAKDKLVGFQPKEEAQEVSPFSFMRTVLATTTTESVLDELRGWFEEITLKKEWEMTFEQNLTIESRKDTSKDE